MKGLYSFQRYLPFVETIWLVLIRQSDVVSYFFMLNIFFNKQDHIQMGEETVCRRVHYTNAGS